MKIHSSKIDDDIALIANQWYQNSVYGWCKMYEEDVMPHLRRTYGPLAQQVYDYCKQTKSTITKLPDGRIFVGPVFRSDVTLECDD